jgi:hypothetical protein
MKGAHHSDDYTRRRENLCCSLYYMFAVYCPCLELSANSTNSVAQEPEGSSPHSQQPDTGPYPEPVESNPHPQANLSMIHSDPIFPPTPWSSKWSPSLGLSHQNLVHFSVLSHACYMPRPPHSHWLDLPNEIWGWVQIMKFLIVQLPPFSRHLIPLRSKYPSQNPVLKHTQSMLFP